MPETWFSFEKKLGRESQVAKGLAGKIRKRAEQGKGNSATWIQFMKGKKKEDFARSASSLFKSFSRNPERELLVTNSFRAHFCKTGPKRVLSAAVYAGTARLIFFYMGIAQIFN